MKHLLFPLIFCAISIMVGCASVGANRLAVKSITISSNPMQEDGTDVRSFEPSGVCDEFILTEAEVVEDIRARDERYMAEIAELETMRFIACAEQQRIEGKNEDACKDYGDWPMASLGINRSAAGEQALVNLFSLKLGVGSQESLSCSMQIRGKSILPQLRKLDITQARNHCLRLLERIKANDVEDYSKVKPEHVCNTEDTIRVLRDMSISDIEAGKRCEPWNID